MTLTLASRGILIVPSFITLVLANIAIFLFAFLPPTGRVSLWVLEPGVVLADAFAIKLFTSGGLLQGDAFLGVTWRRALLASFLGNSTSFFAGMIGSHARWILHKTAVLE